jgi:hypothetical protein
VPVFKLRYSVLLSRKALPVCITAGRGLKLSKRGRHGIYLGLCWTGSREGACFSESESGDILVSPLIDKLLFLRQRWYFRDCSGRYHSGLADLPSCQLWSLSAGVLLCSLQRPCVIDERKSARF